MLLTIDRELSQGPSLALSRLTRALTLRGETVRELGSPDEEPSLLIPLPSNRFLIAGLTYALLEAARAIEVAPTTQGSSLREGLANPSVLDHIPAEIGSPHLSWRSMQLFLCNRELRRRFGETASAVEQLYAEGSQILPLLTTVLQMSASLWTFWPERYAGRGLDEDAKIEPSDPTQFYRIDEYAVDILEGRLSGKWTPLQVSHLLREVAAKTKAAIGRIDATTTELRYTCLDFSILSKLAEYHAGRMEAATSMALFRRTLEPGLLFFVLEHLKLCR